MLTRNLGRFSREHTRVVRASGCAVLQSLLCESTMNSPSQVINEHMQLSVSHSHDAFLLVGDSVR